MPLPQGDFRSERGSEAESRGSAMPEEGTLSRHTEAGEAESTAPGTPSLGLRWRAKMVAAALLPLALG